MPVVHPSTYSRPWWLFDKHLQTIIPAGLRIVNGAPKLQRERIETWDHDFLDLDWAKKGNTRVCIISHGLEGNSVRPYMQGMTKALSSEGWDVCAWNYRGCSGEINRNARLYHSGATDDLEQVIKHVISSGYKKVALVGFSLGGNITLKYLGEASTENYDEVKAAVVFSVPLDLEACAYQIQRKENFLYSMRFVKSLKAKVRAKAAQYPDLLDLSTLDNVKSVYEFDDQYTAPFHGFKDAMDYYHRCSAINFVEGITIPTLIVNAANDPFLADACLNPAPFVSIRDVFFEMPNQGGHCGFATYANGGAFWSELRAAEFLEEHL